MKLSGCPSALNVQPDETLAFKVSSEFANYSARVVRFIHGDDRLGSPGFKCEHVPSSVDREYAGEVQAPHPAARATLEGRITVEVIHEVLLSLR